MIKLRNIPALLGADNYRKPKDVMREMVREYHGVESEFDNDNPACQWRKGVIKDAMQDFELDTGRTLIKGAEVFRDKILAKSDATTDNGMPVIIDTPLNGEIKTPNESRKLYLKMQYLMFAFSCEHSIFYSWTTNEQKLVRVSYNEDTILQSLVILQDFMEEFDKEKNRDDVKDFYLSEKIGFVRAEKLANEYRAAKEKLDAAKKDLEKAKAKLIEIAEKNDCKANISGLNVFKVEKQGSISYANALKDIAPNADLEKYRGKPSTSWTVKG